MAGQRLDVVGIPPLSEPLQADLPTKSMDVQTAGSTRSFTHIKQIYHSSWNDVWLCKWHTKLRPKEDAPPLARIARYGTPDDKIIALKVIRLPPSQRLANLKELEILRYLPNHPNVIDLYDYFLTPEDNTLYLAIGALEGNLYHLFNARKDRPFAGGLVSSILHQILLGINHLHANNYFHRDLIPENILVTTQGYFGYPKFSEQPLEDKEEDIIATIKVGDFGLAQKTSYAEPYTEYVTTRWYRAPEVLLLSRHYTKAIDMWAFGVIAAEVLNLRPLFPGTDQIDQVAKICGVLGSPSEDAQFDKDGNPLDGGEWTAGIILGRSVGFEFPRVVPRPFSIYFRASVPKSLLDCIRKLLSWDPNHRPSSQCCLEHPYFQETAQQREIELSQTESP